MKRPYFSLIGLGILGSLTLAFITQCTFIQVTGGWPPPVDPPTRNSPAPQ